VTPAGQRGSRDRASGRLQGGASRHAAPKAGIKSQDSAPAECCLATKVVLDWDGTVTEVDSLHMVIERFGDREAYVALESELGRTLTLDEVIGAEMATIVAPLDEVVAWLVENVRIRRGFHELVAIHDPLIVSAGFHETIEPILRREGVEPRVVANHVSADPAGWRAAFSPGVICDVCGERCKRAAVGALGPFAYVGDGVSDRCVSLAADRRFARDGLARWLDRQGVPYEPFGDLHDVLEALAAPTA
jgi:2-hydroxy-3-keto-5-methylthiopentenyl-1-phosphate phosphatase